MITLERLEEIIKSKNSFFWKEEGKHISLLISKYTYTDFEITVISNYNPNKAFRSTSNDLIDRNIFYLNSAHYNNLIKNKNKNYSILSEQNIKENNYLNPLEVFKIYKKYSLPSNVVILETYNISKIKYYPKAIFL